MLENVVYVAEECDKETPPVGERDHRCAVARYHVSCCEAFSEGVGRFHLAILQVLMDLREVLGRDLGVAKSCEVPLYFIQRLSGGLWRRAI